MHVDAMRSVAKRILVQGCSTRRIRCAIDAAPTRQRARALGARGSDGGGVRLGGEEDDNERQSEL